MESLDYHHNHVFDKLSKYSETLLIPPLSCENASVFNKGMTGLIKRFYYIGK